MLKLKNSSWKLQFALFSTVALVCLSVIFWGLSKDPHVNASAINKVGINLADLRKKLAIELRPHLNKNEMPKSLSLSWPGQSLAVDVEYSLDPDMQALSDRLLNRYRPDYGAVVMMDADSGQVLALSSYQKQGEHLGNLALVNSFPAASIFKIVTAAAAVDSEHLNSDSKIQFNGSNHTLFKKNVFDTTVNRWTRSMSLREAFSKSVNTVFGKLGVNVVGPSQLNIYAHKLGFNQEIPTDLPVSPSFTDIPEETSFHTAELASGYNRVTTLSPLHGAMIAASIAADGVMRAPYVIKKIRDDKGDVLYEAMPFTVHQPFSAATSDDLKDMMEATIMDGTSRKSFKELKRDKIFDQLIVGGKTGSLTGTSPRGKNDWFVGFAIRGNQRIAISAITVNKDQWTVKSSFLAQTMIKTYFKQEAAEEVLQARQEQKLNRSATN